MKLIPLLLISLVATQAVSALPHGCERRGFGYNGRALILNQEGSPQTFYLLNNKDLKQTIVLKRIEEPGEFMMPSLISKIEPNHWSAFASDLQNLGFFCFVKRLFLNEAQKAEQTLVPVDCREVLEVCQYPRVKFALSNMGSYWVSTNKTRQQVIRDSAGKGILLRW